jgi:hypothetical protein
VALSVEDRLAVHELVSLHGHLMDSGEFDRMDELFCADVVYDVSGFGRGETARVQSETMERYVGCSWTRWGWRSSRCLPCGRFRPTRGSGTILVSPGVLRSVADCCSR